MRSEEGQDITKVHLCLTQLSVQVFLFIWTQKSMGIYNYIKYQIKSLPLLIEWGALGLNLKEVAILEICSSYASHYYIETGLSKYAFCGYRREEIYFFFWKILWQSTTGRYRLNFSNFKMKFSWDPYEYTHRLESVKPNFWRVVSRLDAEFSLIKHCTVQPNLGTTNFSVIFS